MIRRRFCALDTMHHTEYKLESKLPDEFHCTLPSTLLSTLLIALDCTLPACFTIRSQLLSMAHSQPARLTLSSKFSRCSQVHSEYAPKYTPGHALKDAPNRSRWHTPSLLDCTLSSMLSRCSQAYSRAHSQIHSQLHSMTLPACLTIYSQASSQDALKNTSEYAPKYTSESLLSVPPSRSEVHSRVPSQVHS